VRYYADIRPALRTKTTMKTSVLTLCVIALYLLHQDLWFWRTPNPMIFGFIPIGLFYHVCYTLAASVLMWMLVQLAWPSHLEEAVEDRESGKGEVR
jgi:Protein of unknown function (DUF3311)